MLGNKFQISQGNFQAEVRLLKTKDSIPTGTLTTLGIQ